ncbi:MAG: hypothetical protein A3H93_16790 [Rhodocyclales bacterium RIFCSPLOWO2_02_FULL_63_24]|nr:MAG: hypothetical protein A3H93_16790 [Rhodocyclales bacterium RIFCSPLOWO2_02_FULL_63_24]
MNRTLLLVDDEASILHALVRLFHSEGYNLLTANSGEEALRLLANNEVQVVLSDQRMPQMTGVELLAKVKDLYPDSVRMVLSGYAEITAVTDAVNKGNIYKFLFKPWDNDLLRANVREAFDRFDLTQQGAQFSKIYENTVEGIIIADHGTLIRAVNPAFSIITGYAPEEVIGKTPALLKSGNHDKAFYQEMWSALEQHGKWTGEIWNKRKSGEIYPEWLNITVIRDSQGSVSQYVALFSDITEHKRNEERLRYQAYHDGLTDLPNRLMFGENLELTIAQAERTGQQAAILLMDLDHFKFVNDTLGHDHGDKLLLAVAERLKATLRKGDTLARMGGDEFTLLLPQIKDTDEIAAVIKKIVTNLTTPFRVGDDELTVTASIGISSYPQDGTTPEELLKNADSALYQAKEAGRNTYIFFTAAMTARAKERIVVENELRHALSSGEIEVFYQPKMRIRDQRITGMEALVRWNHPSRGLVGPKDFIAIAEETGQIIPLGKLVLEEACRQTVEWHRQGWDKLRVAVNLSAYQFRDEGLFDAITHILEQTGIDPHLLEIELTESVVMHDAEASIELLLMLKRMGIGLAIDDFGTGYSSLSYLKRLPFDTLKVDQSFVRDVTTDHHSAELVRTIIGMAHGFKLEVIAEGVETQEQLDFLRKHDCDVIQGYLLAKPLTAREFKLLLGARPEP